MHEQPTQLDDTQRSQLAQELTVKKTHNSRSLGIHVRGQPLTESVAVGLIPNSLEGADVSVCGQKGFVLDEQREFTLEDGSTEVVDCAAVAALSIEDSPVHVHGYTREIYKITRGYGYMVLNDEIREVGPGNVVILEPGVVHGVVSKDPNVPVFAELTFVPGLAPRDKPHLRDEQILFARTSERITELRKQQHTHITEVVG